MIAEYQEASDDKKLQMEQRYGKKQLQTLVENAMSENWIKSNSQKCPKCQAAIEVFKFVYIYIFLYIIYRLLYIDIHISIFMYNTLAYIIIMYIL